MILQALTEYYRALEQQGKIAAPGWGPVKVSFALCIGDDGTLNRRSPCRQSRCGERKRYWLRASFPFPPR